jgi:hypothetical protein
MARVDELVLTLGVIRDHTEYSMAFWRVLYILYNILRITVQYMLARPPINVAR